MGNIARMMTYDRNANERAAIPALSFLDQGLEWFRLDDGVMGGQSSTTVHQQLEEQEGYLHFQGTINTNGGGFCSIRTKFQGFAVDANDNDRNNNIKGIRIRYTGDGKTYKVLLSEGTRGFSTASWQHDLTTTTATTTSSSNGDDDDDAGNNNEEQVQVQEIYFKDLKASMGPRPVPSGLVFDPLAMKELGFMLSLKLSDGSPNPVETYGSGIFPFSLKIHSIEPIIVAKQ